MCKEGNTKNVLVKIPADLSCTGFAKYKYESIDECIAPIVEALQKGAIDMRGSCCGHNKTFGEIHLQDGRVLFIIPKSKTFTTVEFVKDMLRIYNKFFGERKNSKEKRNRRGKRGENV